MLATSNEICWLLQKVPTTSSHGFKTFQEFLDNKQYSRNSILRYERMFDKHFVSTGGLETTEVCMLMSCAFAAVFSLVTDNGKRHSNWTCISAAWHF